MLGYAEDELVDHFSTWEGLLHPDDLEQTLAQIQSFIDAKIKNMKSNLECAIKTAIISIFYLVLSWLKVKKGRSPV